jgi:hypothetical protein
VQETASTGFGHANPAARRSNDLWLRAVHQVEDASLYLARIDGRPVGVASVSVHDGLAILGV